MRINVTYRPTFIEITPIITPKLKEKMMTKREVTIEIIIRANKEMGSPKMTALFLISLYTIKFFIPKI